MIMSFKYIIAPLNYQIQLELGRIFEMKDNNQILYVHNLDNLEMQMLGIIPNFLFSSLMSIIIHLVNTNPKYT